MSTNRLGEKISLFNVFGRWWSDRMRDHHIPFLLIIREWQLLITIRKHWCHKTETEAKKVTTAFKYVLFAVNFNPIFCNKQTDIHRHIIYPESKVKTAHFPVAAMGVFSRLKMRKSWYLKYLIHYWNLIYSKQQLMWTGRCARSPVPYFSQLFFLANNYNSIIWNTIIDKTDFLLC